MSLEERKRKREPRAYEVFDGAPWDSRLPPESINPLSHSPGTLRQFSIAGLPETAREPGKWIPGFPHRPARCTLLDSDYEQDHASPADPVAESSEDERMQKPGYLPRTHDGRWKKRIRTLRDAACIFLEKGDITQARRTFGLLVRSHSSSRPFNMSAHGYWSIAAEILMREGEDIARGLGANTSDSDYQARRIGSAANAIRVRRFFEDLIPRHIYNNKHPYLVSSLHLYPAQFGYEMYHAYSEQCLALQRLESTSLYHDGEDLTHNAMRNTYDANTYKLTSEVPDREHLGTESEAEQTMHDKDTIRRRALVSMTGITARMDSVMEISPHSESLELLRLRGMAALYVADLVVPADPVTRKEDDEWQGLRDLSLQKAEASFSKIPNVASVANGGIVASPDLDATEPITQTLDTLPTRGYNLAPPRPL